MKHGSNSAIGAEIPDKTSRSRLVAGWGGYTLPELGKFVGVSYAAVAQAVAKLDLRMVRDP
jgi:hypothetical protein